MIRHYKLNFKNEKIQKIENSKIKKYPTNRSPPQAPLLQSYNFLTKYAHTLVNWGSNCLPQASLVPFSSPHYTVTCDSLRYAIFLY